MKGFWAGLSLCALAGVAVSAPAWASVPTTVAVEGVLLASGGAAAADGLYDVVFAIYPDAVGGNPVWSEGPVKVSVKNGQWQYALGSTKAINAAALPSSPLYVGLQIGSDPEMPRKALQSVAFAVRAAVAEAVECSGCIGSAQIDAKVMADIGKTIDLSPYAKTASLAKVATTGNHADLIGNPDLSVYAKNTDLGAYAKSASLAKVATTGAYADLTGTPDLNPYVKAAALAKVAGSGLYSDLASLPTLPQVGKSCGTGLVMSGIKADGSYECSASAIAADMIDEISNGLIWNQFVDSASGPAALAIKDGFAAGTDSNLTFPDIGLAQKISVDVNITNNDISKLQILLYAPGIPDPYLVYDKTGTGKTLKTTFNTTTPIASGQFDKDWQGKNLKGPWTLLVKDLADDVPATTDGTVDWTLNIQTLSNQKIQIKGSLIVDKDLTVNGNVFGSNINQAIGYKQAVFTNSQLDMTSGSYTNARSMTYTKQKDNTVLIIDFTENATIRSYAGGWNTINMRILIDGNECAVPGKIERSYPHYSPSPDIYFTDNMAERAICKATTAGAITAGSHTITVQGRRGYCGGNCWGPYWSYNVSSETCTARMGVGEIQDNQ